MSQKKRVKGTGKAKKKKSNQAKVSLRELFNGDQIATRYNSTGSVSIDLVIHTSR